MEKLLMLVATTLFGAIGWWLGEFVGMFTAFALSMVGTAIGVYAARVIVRDYFP